jgi:hypothetical protein
MNDGMSCNKCFVVLLAITESQFGIDNGDMGGIYLTDLGKKLDGKAVHCALI